MKKTHLLEIAVLLVFLSFVGCPTPGESSTTTPGGNATYTVTYNGNGSTGGTVPTDSKNYLQGASVTVLGNTGSLTKTGYTFVGWNTQANGSGTTYSGSQTLTTGSSNVILYALWTTAPTFTVTYNGNGNTGGNVPTDPNNYTQGQTVTVLGNTGSLVKIGYAFSNWNTASNGTGTTYTPGQTFPMGNSNVTLYAQWGVPPTFTVTYNANGNNTGGTVPIDSNNYSQGQTVTVQGNPNNLVWTGYALAGWNTQQNGGGTTYYSGQTFPMGSGNVTLYALWIASTPGLAYTAINGNTAYSVTAGTATSGSVVIPAYWSCEPVTSIGASAFNLCSGLTSVTIPNTVTSIGNGAFTECTGLTTVTIPNSVHSLAASVFTDCYNLTSVTIGNSVTNIGVSCFSYCNNLTSVTIPNSVTSIGDEAFYSCSAISSVTIPASVTFMGMAAFGYCNDLTSVVVNPTTPPTSDASSPGFFYNCVGLSIIEVPVGTVTLYQTANLLEHLCWGDCFSVRWERPHEQGCSQDAC